MRWRLRRTAHRLRAVIERSLPPRQSQIEPVRPEIFAETAAVIEHVVPNNIPIGYRSRLGH